jgi:hypothetical protein
MYTCRKEIQNVGQGEKRSAIARDIAEFTPTGLSSLFI